MEEECDRLPTSVHAGVREEERTDGGVEGELLAELPREGRARRLPGANLAARELPGARPGAARRAPADEVAVAAADHGGDDQEGRSGGRPRAVIGSAHRATVHVLAAVVIPALCVAGAVAAADKMDFWSDPRAGANFANRVERPDRLAAARAYGIEWIRLTPDKWASAARDFLVGDCAVPAGPVAADLARLAAVVAQADSLGLKVVIALRSLPGARWRDPHAQAVADSADPAAAVTPADDTLAHWDVAADTLAAGGAAALQEELWRVDRQQEEAAALWAAIALRFRDHPAVVGYEILSAPSPLPAGTPNADFDALCVAARGTPADLDRFYARVVAAIRAVDPMTPILVAAGRGASAEGFRCLEPLADERVLYAFHMYEPRAYTDRRLNRGRYRYPGPYPGVEGTADSLRLLDREALLDLLSPVIRWQSAHRIPSNRIVVTEFGVHRQAKGAAAYLGDVLRAYEDVGWHWAFFAFREDTWPGMDYELGTRALGAAYWRALRRGEEPQLPRGPNPLFDVIRGRLEPAP
jgi:hypothetical protein